LSGFVTGCVVGLVLLVMTPVFEKLPLNVMGAIVVGNTLAGQPPSHLCCCASLTSCVMQ
jgi:hypothetical protein